MKKVNRKQILMVVKILLSPIKKPLKRCLNKYLEKRSLYYLKKNHSKPINRPINVGFIVYEPETWDKLQPLYEQMSVNNYFNPKLIVVPSFDVSLSVGDEYSYEKEFFESKYGNVISAIGQDDELLKDFDYIFYQDHYDTHYPEWLRSHNVVKYTRICYVPYGYSLLQNFTDLFAHYKLFLQNVSVLFAECVADGKAVEEVLQQGIKLGIQKVEYLGYPALEEYMKIQKYNSPERITWMPRWTYDDKYGGSHFLEYKDQFVHLAKEITDHKMCIRPHPMLFENFFRQGLMSREEIEAFHEECEKLGIDIEEQNSIYDVICNTGLLITDISSVIVSFFATGRPIIYCKCEMQPNEDMSVIQKGLYIAESWEEVQYYVQQILKGNDYLRLERQKILESKFFTVHQNSAANILEYLMAAQ